MDEPTKKRRDALQKLADNRAGKISLSPGDARKFQRIAYSPNPKRDAVPPPPPATPPATTSDGDGDGAKDAPSAD